MEKTTLMRALEAILFVTGEPIHIKRLEDVFRDDGIKPSEIRQALLDLKRDYIGRGIEIQEIGGGYQMRTGEGLGQYILRLDMPRPTKLSQAALETLAIIAYRQPVTRTEAEEVRGVDCGGVVRSLAERGLIRVVGKKDVPGRPLLYGTTKKFLEVFGLSSLTDLPSLRQIEELTGSDEEGETAVPDEKAPEETQTPDSPPEPDDEPRLPFDDPI